MKRLLALLLTGFLALAVSLPVAPARASTTPSDIYLVGPGGTGGTTTVATSTAAQAGLGTVSGVDQWVAQSFMVPAGVVSQFTVKFGANTGSPTGTVTWEIDSDNLSIPGTQLNTGTFTPTASATNTISVSSGSFLMDNTNYWLVMKSTNTQAAATSWNINRDTTNPYANGLMATTTNAGTNWNEFTTSDLSITITTVTGAPPSNLINNKLAQSFKVGSEVTTPKVSLYLKKVGSPTGTLTLNIETDGGDYPSSNLLVADATATAGESSLTTSYGLIDFTFAATVLLQPDTKYWLVLSTNRTDTTNYIAWAADSACGLGDLKHYTTFWAADQKLAIYDLNSSTATPTTSADLYSYDSLPDGGRTYAVNYSTTIGEIAIFACLAILIIMQGFSLRQRGRR